MRRVVITGIAPIVYAASGKDEFWDLLLNKKTYLMEAPPEFKCKSHYYMPKPDIEPIGHFMEESSKIAVKCARLAKDDSGLNDFKEFGVILGIGIGSLGTAFNSYAAHIGGTIEGNRYTRMVIPMTMPNAAASHIAIDLGAEKFAYTVNTACSSGNTAVGEAYEAIKAGRADGVITGGVECLDDGNGTGAVMRAFDGLTVLTKSADGLPRPFSNSRSGFLFNMGAGCAIILEELEFAKKRGAEIYAEIAGYAHNNDAYNIMQMEPSGRKLEELFSAVNISEVDYINAHGTGTVQNDALEADVIKRVFGEKKPYVNSTKGIIGHSIGASAALETAVCALSIKNNMIHGNLIDDDVIDGLNLPVEAVETRVNCAVNCSYGFGGHNTLLVLKRYNG